eukprot:scaffold93829_cov19-Tisochrysis_lutea.AAC.3
MRCNKENERVCVCARVCELENFAAETSEDDCGQTRPTADKSDQARPTADKCGQMRPTADSAVRRDLKHGHTMLTAREQGRSAVSKQRKQGNFGYAHDKQHQLLGLLPTLVSREDLHRLNKNPQQQTDPCEGARWRCLKLNTCVEPEDELTLLSRVEMEACTSCNIMDGPGYQSMIYFDKGPWQPERWAAAP